jgi:preprotein translocase subunit SecG
MLSTILLIVQIILGSALVFLILIQAKGIGLGTPFGGALWGSYSTKRGVEKVIFNLTIALAILFFLSSLAQIILG